MTFAKHFDPHAPGVVNVRSDRLHRTSTARYVLRPQLEWQVFDEVHRYAMIRVPRLKQRICAGWISGTVLFAQRFLSDHALKKTFLRAVKYPREEVQNTTNRSLIAVQ